MYCNNYDWPTCPAEGDPARGSRPYPYSSAWPDLSFDKDYLLDVVGQETSPGLFDPVALQAQAIAARSYAWYQINNSPYNVINNSTSFQVFLPFKFETFGPDPDNASDPCQSTNLSPDQTKLCDAVGTDSHYLSWDAITNTAFLPARANFFSDALDHTTSSGDKAYLIGVEDPISNDDVTCSASNSAAHSWGMSQEGAQRWATGDQCGSGYAPTSLPWSVRWTRTEQILFHYYADVHIRDGNKQVVTVLSPPDRWNPLQINGTVSGELAVLHRGPQYSHDILVQNTGLGDWDCTVPTVLDYHLRYRWARDGKTPQDGEQSTSLCGVAQAGSEWTEITVRDIPNWGYGNYTVQFDLIESTTSGENRFSPAWPTYDVAVFVIPTGLQAGYNSPATGAQVNYQVHLSAYAGGDVNSAGVDHVWFRANVGGGGWETIAENGNDCPIGQTCPYETTWDMIGIPDQTNITLGFDVRDETGTTSQSPGGTRDISIHDDPPTIALDTANGDSSASIWSNQRNWTFVGTASDPEDHLGPIEFHCAGDGCGTLGSHTDGNDWSHTQNDILGQNVITFSVSDPAVNVATSRHLDLRIDIAAPATTLTLNDGPPASWYSGTVQAQLDATDNGSGRATSGVDEITYSIDGNPSQTHIGSQVAFSMNGEGPHTIQFYAMDIVDNPESTHTTDFGIDDTAPVAQSTSVVTGSGLGNCVVPTGTVWLDLSASDEGSGVRSMRLSNDGASWSPWRGYVSRTLWQLASTSEASQVYFQVKDGVGWKSTLISRTVSYSPPDVWCTYVPVVTRQ